MIRICSTLANAGYQVHIVGRKLNNSIALVPRPYTQKRLWCLFEKGPLFYFTYNLQLFFYLLVKPMDALCAVDLDTILPVLFVSKLKGKKRIYDAHELFCEMKEIVTRPRIYTIWKAIEKFAVPQFRLGYTVNEPIANEFKKMYNINYTVIRNIARLNTLHLQKENYILYQGAVNEGRSFETLIPAMQHVYGVLIICGDGNYMQQTKALVEKYQLQSKVIFKGMCAPDLLAAITAKAYIGITLFERSGLSNYYSLANRFFDYIQHAVPQLCVNYPVYAAINDEIEIAVLINDLSATSIANALNNMIADKANWQRLHDNCIKAAAIYNWENEEKKLVHFYKQIPWAN